jgi:hypothetical protein
MWKTVAIAGTAAALIGGAGTAAFAASGTDTPTPSPSSVSSPAQASSDGATTKADKRKVAANRLRGTVHMTWVRENKKTKVFTTHNAIRGQVTAVSATSVTIVAADKVTETFVFDSGTMVRSRTTKSAVPISDVKVGDRVLVVGTGTTTLTASRVVELRK